jgi:DNA N-6-adenine-methyltransferase (Dam)
MLAVSPPVGELVETLEGVGLRIKERDRRLVSEIWHQGKDLMVARSLHRADQDFLEWLDSLDLAFGRSQAYNFMNVADAIPADRLDSLDKIQRSAAYELCRPSAPPEALQKALAIAESGQVVRLSDAKNLIADAEEIPDLDGIIDLYSQMGEVEVLSSGQIQVSNQREHFLFLLHGREDAWRRWNSKYRDAAVRIQQRAQAVAAEVEAIQELYGFSLGEKVRCHPYQGEVIGLDEERVCIAWDEWKTIWYTESQLRQEWKWDGVTVPEQPETVQVVQSEKTHPAGLLASAKTDHHPTPERIWRPALTMLGVAKFDLDPASFIGSPIPCDRIFTKEDDGLQQDWAGYSVWLNPPYSKEGRTCVGEWAEKLLAHKEQIEHAFVLVKSDCRPAWFYTLLGSCSAFAFIRGAVPFGDAQNAAFFGAMLFYFGPASEEFSESYSAIAEVIIR